MKGNQGVCVCVSAFISDHLAEGLLENWVREVASQLGRTVFLRREIGGKPDWFGEWFLIFVGPDQT